MSLCGLYSRGRTPFFLLGTASGCLSVFSCRCTLLETTEPRSEERKSSPKVKWSPSAGRRPEPTGACSVGAVAWLNVGRLLLRAASSSEEAGSSPCVKTLCLWAQRFLSEGRTQELWAPNGKVAERVGGTEGGNNPTPSPSFRGAGAETVAMVTIAPWSGDFFLLLPLLFSKQQPWRQ